MVKEMSETEKFYNMGISLPHYYRAKVYDVMTMKWITIDTAECDSPVCEFHIPENVGKFIPTHPDTNYCIRRQKKC
jgi:hypothetical protein